MMLVKLWDDDEIGGRIYLQVCNLFVDALLGDGKDRFYEHVFLMMHKITATKYHLKNYEEAEQRLFKSAIKSFKKNPNQTREAFELIFELDAFLVQVKSSLDMLVKILTPIVGEGFVRTQTFGDKGDKVISGLEQYKKKKGVNVRAVEDLIRLIQDDKDSWLKKTIEFRDELNHTKGLNGYQFTPVILPNRQVSAFKPRFKGLDTLALMKTVYSNNLEFHQDFLVSALSLKAPGMRAAPENPQRAMKTFNHPSAKFIKWCWVMETSPTPASGNVEATTVQSPPDDSSSS